MAPPPDDDRRSDVPPAARPDAPDFDAPADEGPAESPTGEDTPSPEDVEPDDSTWGWGRREADATAEAPAEREGDDDQPRRIWDPARRAWVGAAHAAPAPPRSAEGGAPPSGAESEEVRGHHDAPRASGPGSPRVGTGLAAVAAGVLGGVIGVVAMLFVPGIAGRTAVRAPSERVPAASPPAVGTLGPAELARAARSWVVSVSASGTVGGRLDEREFTRVATGVVVRPGGVIATTARIMSDADKVVVTLPYGASHEVEVVGVDDVTDVALLRAPVELPAAVLGTAEFVELATPVVAVTSAAGAQPMVVAGTVSAVGQTVTDEDGRILFDLLHVAGPLGMGGGGGAVMSPNGSVIAMTSSLAESSGAAGYAIPIDVVRSVADQMLESDDVRHPWLGVLVQLLDEETTARLGTTGLLVTRVFDGPASGELEAGDIIVEVAGREVEGPLSLLRRTLDARPGDRIELSVLRGDGRRDVEVEVGEQPER